ncbi:MAG: DUF808 domain-containing protein [Pseudomonadota bacterium]
MAAGSLLTLLDDIASLLDDVSAMAQVAAKKTAGVLGDDLALNAQQVSGLQASRELPVVWAVARGSLLNKAILVPAALAISAVAPWAVTPLLMFGGAFLCYEGVEKLVHSWQHHGAGHAEAPPVEALDPTGLVDLEKDKIKGAIRTDFILSAEIIAITLGTVAGAPFVQRVIVVAGIALVMTVGVYGLVAAIVKLDDLGLYLRERAGALARAAGSAILWLAPWLMKALSVLGTAAMFLVGGGILVHGVPPLHHAIEGVGGGVLAGSLLNGVVGVVAGAVALAGVAACRRLLRRA